MNQFIVLVDDNSKYLGVLREELERRGYHVFSCESQERGLEQARKLDDASFAIDVDLGPGGGARGGIALVREINVLRQAEPRKRFLLGVLSSKRDTEDQAVEAGADVFLEKGDTAETDALRFALQAEGATLRAARRRTAGSQRELAEYHYDEIKLACSKVVTNASDREQAEPVLERVDGLVWEALEWPLLREKERSVLALMAGITHALIRNECDWDPGVQQLRSGSDVLKRLLDDETAASEWLMGSGPELGTLRWLPDDLNLANEHEDND